MTQLFMADGFRLQISILVLVTLARLISTPTAQNCRRRKDAHPRAINSFALLIPRLDFHSLLCVGAMHDTHSPRNDSVLLESPIPSTSNELIKANRRRIARLMFLASSNQFMGRLAELLSLARHCLAL